ncbi:MAG TPA: hypothetical protein VFZ83_07440 [Acidimicrobiia bacterium]|nr:hypothetical protein [Acidimicrobiia bacterium]
MTDDRDANVDLLDEEFERLGRRAGAELRQDPPADGPRFVVRSAHRRRATLAVAAAGATVVAIVAGLFVATSEPEGDPLPVATIPPTVGTGEWRPVAESPLALERPVAAVWTGSEAIVLGSRTLADDALSAVAYDVERDAWRQVADPPAALTSASLAAFAPALQWTGSEVLTATSDGEVFAYDPDADRWESRARADASMVFDGTDTLVAVSSRGVLARSSAGWWWYAASAAEWESIPAPAGGVEYSKVSPLDAERIVAIAIDGDTLSAAVFSGDTRQWRTGQAIGGVPESDRAETPTECDGADGLLVCFAEGFGSLAGVVVDPLDGIVDTFALGNHSNTLTIKGIPWMTHDWKLLSPRTAAWEDLPPSPYDDVDGFSAAVWTGTEIVFFGGSNSERGQLLRATAAYSPLRFPGT